MGFSENKCKRALFACNNDAEAAMNWIFENIDDACNKRQPMPLQPGRASYSIREGV